MSAAMDALADDATLPREPWTNPGAERRVVASALADPAAHALAAAECRAEDFRDPLLRAAWAAMATLASAGEPCDAVTVASTMRRPLECATLAALAPHALPAKHAAAAARIVADNATARRTAGALAVAAAGLREDKSPAREVCAAVLAKVTEAATPRAAGEMVSFHDIGVATWASIEAAGAGVPRGVATGVPDLDEIIGGLRPGQLAMLAGVTGTGKTVIAMQVALHAARAERARARLAGTPPRRVLVFSCEMTGEELILRAACGAADIPMARALAGALSLDELRDFAAALNDLADLPVYVQRAARTSTLEIRAAVLHAQATDGALLVVIDYLQILDPVVRDPSEVRQYEEMTRELKRGVAGGCNVPVLCLSQFTRAPGKDGRRPTIHDLRGSGSAENDSDLVMLLHLEAPPRDEKSGKPTYPKLQHGVLIVGKQRNGPPGEVDLLFERARTRFVRPKRGPDGAPIAEAAPEPTPPPPDANHQEPADDRDEDTYDPDF